MDESLSSDQPRGKKRKQHSSTKKHERKEKKERKHHHKKSHKKNTKTSTDQQEQSQIGPSVQIPLQLPKAEEIQTKAPRNFAPMTKEQYEKQQSVVTRVYDPDTGRHRLVKGSGEIVEEIVSKERQKQINKQATMNEGVSFQAGMAKLL